MACFAHGRKAKAKGRGKKPSGTPRKRRGVKLRPTELAATELALADASGRAGGAGRGGARRRRRRAGRYREPLGGHALMLAALPVDKVVPTPFQRDISDAHVRRLTQAMDKTQALPGSDHRRPRADRRRGVLDAQRLPPADRAQGAGREDRPGAAGARARGRLPDPGAEHREGAQPAREGDRRASGCTSTWRRARRPATRSDFALEFEEPALATLGFAYEERGGSRAARTTRSCARSTSGSPGSSPKALPSASERAGLLLASTRR